MIRRLLPLAGVIFALLSTTARAEGSPLIVTGIDRTTGAACWVGTLDTLQLDWGGGTIGDCPDDMVGLTITGTFWLDQANPNLAIISDDGVRVWVDDQLLYDFWYPRSCWGDLVTTQLTPGAHQIRVEWYEDYGGACLSIYQYLDTGEAVPLQLVAPIPPVEPATTTTAPEPPTTLPEPSTTVSEPSTTTYQPPPSSTSPTSTATIETTIQTSTSGPPPATPIENTSDVTTTILTTSTTTIPNNSIPETITPDITPEQAIAVATDAATVATLTPDEATEVFQAIDENNLTPDEAAAIVEAVQNAPEEIRQAFESAVNVFSGSFDNYIPVGSRVPVSTRRIIIITTGLLVAMPPPRRK